MKKSRRTSGTTAIVYLCGAFALLASMPSCSGGSETSSRRFVDDKGRECTYDCGRDSCGTYRCTPDPAPVISCDAELPGSVRCYVLEYVPDTDHQIGLCDACCGFSAETGVRQVFDKKQCAPIVCKSSVDCPSDNSLCHNGRCAVYN